MTTVTLNDGRQVPANSQEFLAETQKRKKHVDALMGMALLEQRRAYLATVQALEGGRAAEAVRAQFAVAWAQKRGGDL